MTDGNPWKNNKIRKRLFRIARLVWAKIDADVPSDSNIHNKQTEKKERRIMSSNKSTMVPNAREAMNKFKMEAASEVGVNLKQGYNGDLTSKQAGSVGGQMVKKMIESYENGMK